MTKKLNITFLALIGLLIYGCKPKHHIDSYIVNNSNDTLLFTNINTVEPELILPGKTCGVYLDILYQKPYPEKRFECCPCEISNDFTISLKNKDKMLLKNPYHGNNWTKPSIAGEKLKKEITCIFEINPEDIK